MVIDNQTVRRLVQEALRADCRAIKALYEAYANAMFNLSLRMTGNRQDAEDIVQEAFIKAFRDLKQLKDSHSFGGWLKQIVINSCLQLARKKIIWESLDGEPACENDEDENWIAKINIEKVHHAIKELPEGCRQVFLLYATEQYTHKQIGLLLNVSPSTSKSQYLRAKTLLKNQLKTHLWTV